MTALYILSLVTGSILYDSVIEYLVHRFPMHKKIPLMGHFFRNHALAHHPIYDREGYHDHEGTNVHTIRLAAWAGPLLIVSATMPTIVYGFFTESWTPAVVLATVSALYYLAFEYVHVCMHHPKGRWTETTRWFKFLTRHHELHHTKWGKNFNLVLPFGDLIFGTLAIPEK